MDSRPGDDTLMMTIPDRVNYTTMRVPYHHYRSEDGATKLSPRLTGDSKLVTVITVQRFLPLSTNITMPIVLNRATLLNGSLKNSENLDISLNLLILKSVVSMYDFAPKGKMKRFTNLNCQYWDETWNNNSFTKGGQNSSNRMKALQALNRWQLQLSLCSFIGPFRKAQWWLKHLFTNYFDNIKQPLNLNGYT